MRRIVPESLWLGTVGDVLNMDGVYRLGIQALVDLAYDEPPAQLPLPRDLAYCRFPLVDGPGNPLPILRAAIDTTVALLDAQIPTLVFCSAGMSRTPAIAATALAILRGRNADAILAEVCRNHPADVSSGLWNDIKGVIASRQ